VVFSDQLAVVCIEPLHTALQTIHLRFLEKRIVQARARFRLVTVKRHLAGHFSFVLLRDKSGKTVKELFGLVIERGIEFVSAGCNAVEGFIYQIGHVGTAMIAEKSKQAAPDSLIHLPGLLPVVGEHVKQGVKLALPEVEAFFHEVMQANAVNQ
jgi:hypothetical protein